MIAYVFRPLVDWFLPRSLERVAAFLGAVFTALAICVAAFFPVSAYAGTETTTARWTTAVALLAAGMALHFSRGRIAVVGAGVAALLAGAVLAPAWWMVFAAGGTCLYAAIAILPRRAPADAHAGSQANDDPPVTEMQEVTESVALALCLALVVREYGFEAFKIPTGSMEPTILGDSSNGRHGDRLLAFKALPIRRWDIAVFRFPLFRNTNYIKRTIGLPGEQVELRNGDVYVNGVIAPKPDTVQQVMWQNATSAGDDEDWVRKFDPGMDSPWALRQGFAEVDAQGHNASAAGNGPAAVRWLEAVPSYDDDLRASFDVEIAGPAAKGTLWVSLDGAHRRVVLELGPQGAKVSAPGADWSPGIGTLADFGTSFRLGLSMSDRVVRIWKDGRQVASFQHPDTTNDGVEQGRVRIGATNLRARIRNFAVQNDVQYGMSGTTSWSIPADGYVMLGDNTGSSRDSRYWTANVVRTRDGREFVAPDRARVTEDREIDSFRQRPDGGVDFLDSYGIEHHFTKDEIEPVRRNVSLPFAKQDDIVGRAFFIFYPFPPFGDFRPRFLR